MSCNDFAVRALEFRCPLESTTEFTFSVGGTIYPFPQNLLNGPHPDFVGKTSVVVHYSSSIGNLKMISKPSNIDTGFTVIEIVYMADLFWRVSDREDAKMYGGFTIVSSEEAEIHIQFMWAV